MEIALSTAKPAITRVTRFALVTADVAASIDFFCAAFDADVVSSARPVPPSLMGLSKGRVEQTLLRIDAQQIALLTFDPPGRAYPEGSTSTDLWFQHFAIVVSDMAAAYARLMRVKGVTPISVGGPQTLPPASGGVAAFKFRDGEGHPLELLAFADGGAPEAWQRPPGAGLCLGIDHSAIAVGDLRASLSFFTDTLGLTLGARSDNRGPEQARLDDEPNVRVKVRGLFPSTAPPHIELLGYDIGRRAPIDAATCSADIAATQIVLQTPSLDPILEAVSAAGGSAIVSRGVVALADGCRAVMLRDPDGHRFVIEEVAASARPDRMGFIRSIRTRAISIS